MKVSVHCRSLSKRQCEKPYICQERAHQWRN